MTITELEAEITKLKNTYKENANVGLERAKLLLIYAEELGYQEGICKLKSEIAKGYYYTAQYLSVINYANEAYNIAISDNNYSIIIDCLNMLSCAYHELGDFQHAMSYQIKSLPYSENLSDEVHCRALCNIGTIYKESGNYQLAMNYYNKCINIVVSEDSVDPPQLFALLNICDIYIDTNNPFKANTLINNVINIFFKDKFTSYAQIYIYYLKAKINYVNGNFEFGLNIINKAFTYCEKTQSLSLIAQLYHLKGKYMEALDDNELAIEYYNKSYATYKDSVMSKSMEFCLESLTNIYETIGDYKKSYYYLKQYVEENIRMKKNRDIQKLKNMELLNEINNNKLQNEILKFKQLELLKTSGLLEKSINQVKLLNEINMYIASSNDIVEIAQRVYNRTKEFLLSDVFGIATCNYKEDTLTLNVYIKHGEIMPSYCERLSSSKTLAAKCIKEMKPVIISKSLVAKRSNSNSKDTIDEMCLNKDNSDSTIIYFPLLYENTPIGAITFQSYTIDFFQETQIKFIEVLSEYIAIAVNNAIISENLKREISEKSRIQRVLANVNDDLLKISSIDSLTCIPNRRNLENKLNTAYFEQIEESGNISITMIDIDRFKKYNDTYGHQQGDFCLKTIAELLLMNTDGKNSFVGRYGGEEFMLVQYNTDFDTAYNIIEDIRKQVFDMAIKHEKSEYKLVTLSFGMLYLNKVSKKDTISSLIEKADNALYSAKINGRNRVEYIMLDGVDNT